MEQKTVLKKDSSELLLRLDTIEEKVLEQFDLMEQELGLSLDFASQYYIDSSFRKVFLEKLSSLRELVSSGEVDPRFTLNINYDDDFFATSRPVNVIFFPFAGNPPHWGHVLSLLSAIVETKADKVVIVSNGNDFRKPELPDASLRYELIRDVVSLFEPFFVFGELARENFPGESYPMTGEYSLFRFLSLNPMTEITAHYFAGSDHLHRSVVRGDEVQNDTIGYLEENIDQKLFEYDSKMHTVAAIISARTAKEYDTKIAEIVNPKIAIERLDSLVSFSSTQIRDALSGEGLVEALVFLPYVCFKRICDNKWYIPEE